MYNWPNRILRSGSGWSEVSFLTHSFDWYQNAHRCHSTLKPSSSSWVSRLLTLKRSYKLHKMFKTCISLTLWNDDGNLQPGQGHLNICLEAVNLLYSPCWLFAGTSQMCDHDHDHRPILHIYWINILTYFEELSRILCINFDLYVRKVWLRVLVAASAQTYPHFWL